MTGDVPVTFGGAKAAAIPAAGFLLSDRISLSYSYGAILATTVYIEGTNPTNTFHSCYCEEQNPAGLGTRFPQGFGEDACVSISSRGNARRRR